MIMTPMTSAGGERAVRRGGEADQAAGLADRRGDGQHREEAVDHGRDAGEDLEHRLDHGADAVARRTRPGRSR